MRDKFLGPTKISVRIGRQLNQLAIIVSVPFGNFDGPGGFGYHEPVFSPIQVYSIGGSPWNDDEVALMEWKDSEHGFDVTLSFMDEV